MTNIYSKFVVLFISIIFITFGKIGIDPGFSQTAEAPKLQAQTKTPLESSSGPQAETPKPNKQLKETEIKLSSQIDGWNIDLDRMAKALAREGIEDKDFEQLNKDAAAIGGGGIELIGEISPKLKSLRERFSQLGPLPTKDEPPESAALTIRRSTLSKEIADADGVVKAAQLTIVKARQIRDQIVEARRSRFVKSVTSKSFSILDRDLWQPFNKDLGKFGKGFQILIVNVFSVNSHKTSTASSHNIGVLVGSLLVLVIILVVIRKAIDRAKNKLGDIETDRSILAVSAFFYVLKSGVIPAALVMGILAIWNGFGFLSGNSVFFVNGVAFALAIAIMVRAIAYSFIRPASPIQRIVNLDDQTAHHVSSLVSLALAVLVVSWFFYDAGRAMVLSLEFGIAIKALFALSIAILTATMLRLVKFNSDDDDLRRPGTGISILLNWAVMRASITFGVLVIFVSLLAGYIALAEFAAYQIILSSAILAMLWLELRIVDDVVVGCFQTGHVVNQKISAYLGWGRRLTEQVGVIFTGLLRLSIIIISLLGLLIPWGYRARDWVEWSSAAFFGFQIGDITISLSLILSSIVVFLIGLIVTRSIRRWLSIRFLPTTRLDAGIQNSISTVFGYIGVTIAAAVTVSYAGFDLTSLAFVAGALSVGIGFGLQSVVSNFVSGLILLVERPIKAGDWVVTSGGEGTVQKISVRSTEIRTFDRATVILPNSTLITESVLNWNHNSSMGRIKIPIGVDYDSDPQRVREILLDVLKTYDGILETPPPVVYFMGFGSSSLDFELRCFLADIGYCMVVESDLRYDIFSALSKEGISIPFPQSDVHIKAYEHGSDTLKPVHEGNLKPRKSHNPTDKSILIDGD